MKRGEARKLIAQAIAKGQYDGQTWRTINGTNVQIGDDGEVVNGPAGLKEWAANGGTKGGGKSSSGGGHKVVNGSDISGSYKGDTDIKSVLKAQGYDGLPKVVSGDEFEEAVKDSNFIAQRTYSASSEEILQEYQDMLYNGEFYVDCTVGGSQYGQGMYCAADYNGELTDGIKEEMEHYKELGTDNTWTAAEVDYIAGLHSDDFNQISWMAAERPMSEEEVSAFVHEQSMKYARRFGLEDYKASELSESEKDVIATMKTTKNSGISVYDDAGIALDTIIDKWQDNYTAPSVTETMTLDPSAKIITYNDLQDIKYGGEQLEYKNEKIAEYTTNVDTDPGCAAFLRISSGTSKDRINDLDTAREWQVQNPEKVKSAQDYWNQTEAEAAKITNTYQNYDDGALAALKGYDAINAEYHGASGSYTVILNRTKLILQDNKIVAKAEGQVRMSAMTFEPGKDGRMNAIKDGKVVGWVLPFGTWDGKKDSGKSQGKKAKKSEAERMVNEAVEKATATLARKDSKGRTLPRFMEYEEMEAELDRNDALIKKSSGAERRDLVNRNFDLQSEMDWRWAKSQGSLSSFKNKKEGET